MDIPPNDSPLTAGEPLAPKPSRRPPDQRKVGRPDKRGRKRRPTLLRIFASVTGLVFGLIALLAVAGGIVGFAAWKHFSADLPDVAGLQSYQPRVMSRVYAGDSRLMAELATERRIIVPYSAIPDIVKQAFVSAEDQNFWVHRGVDPLAIIRASLTNLQQMGHGRRPVGASTITQQVAKNILLGNELSLARKAREALLALRIEDSLSKERILELYLNEIYLGAQAYGVAAAAQAYFNKSLDELTIPEAAFLAALPKAPNNYNPFRFPDAAKSRRDWVIDRMAEDHAITTAEATQAKATPILPAVFRRPETVQGADWFAEEVRRQMIDRFGVETTTQGGLLVRTSRDPALQGAAESALRDGLVAYDRTHGGWRGAIGHIGTPQTLRTNWAKDLSEVTRPAGTLPNWTTAVVLEATDSEAKLGWLERPADPRAAALPHVSSMLMSDMGWARPVRDGKLGPTPRRIGDVMQPGDVVLAELMPAVAAQGKTAARPERLVLRQIPAVQGALVSLDPATGRVLAMVGGWSFDTSQFNRATQAQRQPGSSFKPFVYLTALQQNIPPNQRFMDAPFVMDTPSGRWRPGNFEQSFSGPVPLRLALERSLNLVTVRVADKVGMNAVAQNAIAFHVVDSMPRVLPAALGAVETTVIRMAGAYASLAEGGREVIPTLIDTVQDREGHVVWRPEGLTCEGCSDPTRPPTLDDTRKQIADAPSVFQLVTMMQGVVQRGTGFKAGQGLNRPIAGKTGTSQDFDDAWFAGFTADLVTVVWVGFDTPSTLGENETGGNIAAPIWHDYMAVALKNRPVLTFPQPDGVSMVTWDSGAGSRTDAFKPGTEPGSPGGATATAYGAPAASDSGGGAGSAAGGASVDSAIGGLY